MIETQISHTFSFFIDKKKKNSEAIDAAKALLEMERTRKELAKLGFSLERSARIIHRERKQGDDDDDDDDEDDEDDDENEEEDESPCKELSISSDAEEREFANNNNKK